MTGVTHSGGKGVNETELDKIASPKTAIKRPGKLGAFVEHGIHWLSLREKSCGKMSLDRAKITQKFPAPERTLLTA